MDAKMGEDGESIRDDKFSDELIVFTYIITSKCL